MRKIETVFFDMGGTLETLAYDDALRRSASDGLFGFLADHGLEPGVSVDVFHHSVTRGLAAYRAEKMRSWLELPAHRICSEYVLKDFGCSADRLGPVSDEFMLLLETTFYDRRVRPEAEGVLEALRDEGFALGIVSNVMSRNCVEVNLERYGLLEYFDVVVASAVYGRRKPDPRIFLHAAEKIGSPPERCAHVGDKISRDILGARRAGLGLAVLIEHEKIDGPEPTEPAPDAVIRSLDELPSLLERGEPQGNGHRPDAKAILFDAGDVLYYRPNRGRHLECFLETLPERPEPAGEPVPQSLKDEAMCGRISKRDYLMRRVESLGIRDPEQAEEALRVFLEEGNDVAFFDRTRETLHELKARGYMLGIITDTYHSKETKLEWLARNEIAEVWDTFVSSSEEGIRKPDPAIYEAAMRRLGVDASEAAFVGHKGTELDGAAAVGIRTIAFNYEDRATADEYIERFDQLLALFPPRDGKAPE